ncbi:MAG: hypothetical protein U5R06_09405 [candidate division KSB1 bacterium]|nr:hypothetical protein [candidate division KSB1 bacterium]
MDKTLYKIVFDGNVQSGYDYEQVKKQVAGRFKLSEPRVKRLFSGNRIVLKNNIDFETAQKLKSEFESTGALCNIVAMRTTQANDSKQNGLKIRCPHCGHQQKVGKACLNCGFVYGRSRATARESRIAEQQAVESELPSGFDKSDWQHDKLDRSHWQPAVLFVLTFGLYFPFWFYQTWKKLVKYRNIDAEPLLQTLFLLVPLYNLIVIYRLYATIEDETFKERYGFFNGRSAFFIFVLPWAMFSGIVILNIPGPFWLVYSLSAFAIAGAQNALNAMYAAHIKSLPQRPLAVGWLTAAIVFIVLVLSAELLVWISNREMMKQFAEMTSTQIDPLILEPANSSGMDLTEAFADYVQTAKGMMNRRFVDKRKGKTIFFTVMDRLARAKFSDIAIESGPGRYTPPATEVYRNQQDMMQIHDVIDAQNRSAPMWEGFYINVEYLVPLFIDKNKFLDQHLRQSTIDLAFSPLQEIRQYQHHTQALEIKAQENKNDELLNKIKDIAWGIDCYFKRNLTDSRTGDRTRELSRMLSLCGSSYPPGVLIRLRHTLQRNDVRLFVYDVQYEKKGYRLAAKKGESQWVIHDSLDESVISQVYTTENISALLQQL